MKTTAVICEYNPFHKGHALQIDGIRQRGNAVLCIMSGGWVQRGTPALYNKYARAKAAVSCGADVVLELPYPYCCSAAEYFARSGVELANALGVVDELCFGSECGDVDTLKKISDRLIGEDFNRELRAARENKANKSKPYAVLRNEVYRNTFGDDLPIQPNDILGIEYLSALKRTKSTIVPFTYKREEGYSATDSRRLIKEQGSFEMLPEKAAECFKNEDIYDVKNAERAILAFYRSASPEALKGFEGMTDGIADRLVKAAKESTSYEDVVEKLSGKSYTNAKIRRCILHGITGVTTEMLREKPAYTQLLACSEQGRGLLKEIQKRSTVPLLTKPAHYKRLEGKARMMAEFSLGAEGLLTLMCETPKAQSDQLRQSPYIEK